MRRGSYVFRYLKVKFKNVGNGDEITAIITNDAVKELGLTKGEKAIAIIKASEVMIAK